MNKNEIVLKIGKDRGLTASEVTDFLAHSDSDSNDSDWENMRDETADNFLLKNKDNPKEKIKHSRKIFTMNKPTTNETKRVLPCEIVHSYSENVSENKQTVKSAIKYFIATPTSIRVSKPQITTDNWKDRTEGRQVLIPSKLCQGNTSETLTDSDWILVGVIANSSSKKDKNDSNFSIWHLTDLKSLDKLVKVMIFRQVYDQFWKEAAGTVVAILQPKCLPSNETYKSKAFTVDNPLQILVLGRSPDYGICEGKKKSGELCTNVVNKSDCSMCSYHVQSGYFKAISRPGFVNLGLVRLNERKRPTAGGGDVNMQQWNKEPKRQKLDGIYINSNAGLSLKKLHQSGVTTRATEWGLLDRSSLVADPVAVEAPVKMSQKDISMVKLLNKPTAGTKNIIKHIVEKSIDPESVKATNNIINKEAVNDSLATVGKGLTFEKFRQKQLERISSQNAANSMTSSTVVAADQSIDLGYKPVQLDQVSAEVYRAELNKLRIAAKAKEMGGYSAMKEINRQEHLRKIFIPNQR